MGSYHRGFTGSCSPFSSLPCVRLGNRFRSPIFLSDLAGYFPGTDGRLRDLSVVDGAGQLWSRRLRDGAPPRALASDCTRQEFRDGVHGVVSWAIAAVVSGLVIAASVGGVASKAVQPATSPTATTGEPLIAYELDRLFRAERHPSEPGLDYSRAEAGRILLAATGRQGISSEDRTYLARLVAANTGIAPPDAERRVDTAITAATTALHKARSSAVILGFCTAASLLLGAAVGWYGACSGGRHRDEVAPPLSWRW